MKKLAIGVFAVLGIATVLLGGRVLRGQGPNASAIEKQSSENAAHLVLNHPFVATKYARRVKVLPDGTLQFLHNERYPSRVARDADGRLMMQVFYTDHLLPECDHLDLIVPPVCPARNKFVIDPVALTVTHWVEGERAAKGAADFPLSRARLEEVADATSTLPDLPSGFNEEEGEITEVDLGEKNLEGIQVYGKRTTQRYDVQLNGQIIHHMRIHEVWVSQEMMLVVCVIDGDPKGEETIWGLEDVSLTPDESLFHIPDAYRLPDGDGTHHSKSDSGCAKDFEYLKSWFEI